MGIVIVQEPFIDNQEICHSGFNFYWLPKEKKELKVITAIRKDLKDKIIVNHKTDLVYHSYFMLFKIRKLDLHKKCRKKSQVVNIYDNQVGRRCI